MWGCRRRWYGVRGYAAHRYRSPHDLRSAAAGRLAHHVAQTSAKLEPGLVRGTVAGASRPTHPAPTQGHVHRAGDAFRIPVSGHAMDARVAPTPRRISRTPTASNGMSSGFSTTSRRRWAGMSCAADRRKWSRRATWQSRRHTACVSRAPFRICVRENLRSAKPRARRTAPSADETKRSYARSASPSAASRPWIQARNQNGQSACNHHRQSGARDKQRP